MKTRVIPFPRARNHLFVARHAERMAESSHPSAETYLVRQLDVQRETMLKRGVDAGTAEEEIHALEVAIRAELWRLVLTRGGAA